MGKPKKGNKGHDEDFEDNDDTAAKQMEKEVPQEPSGPAAGKKDKSKKKKGKGRGDDDDWDIESELKAMSLEANGGVLEEDAPAPVVSKKKAKTKTKGMSAFQLLGDMDGDDSGDKSDKDSQDEEDQEPKEQIVLETVATESNKSKKKEKGKKKEKPKKQEDEDIDAIMASLDEKPVEKKKGKKKNKTEEVEEKMEEEGTAQVQEVEKVEPKVVTIDDLDEDDEEYTKKRKKKGKKGADAAQEAPATEEGEEKKEAGEDEEGEGDEEGGTVKTAAQKRKEKRDREKQKKLLEKQKQQKKGKKDEGEEAAKKEETSAEVKKEEAGEEAAGEKEEAVSKEGTPDVQGAEGEGDKEEESKEGKKKKKKKGEKEEKEKEKAKPNKKIAALKEHLKKMQEEEQKAKEEEERRRQLEDERIRQLEEQKRLEEEKKNKKKQKKKEREERLKKEGKFLTEKQKQDKRRLEQMLEAMKEAGADLPSKEEVPRKRPVYTKKKKNQAQGGDQQEKSPSPTTPLSPTEEPEYPKALAVEDDIETDSAIEEKKVEVEEVKEEEKKEEVKDAWDAESEEEDEDEDEEDDELEKDEARPKTAPAPTKVVGPVKKAEEPAKKVEEEEESDDEEDEEDEDEDDESEDESDTESDDELTPAERGRDKVMKRAEKASKTRTVEDLRAPVVCVLGHVDTGKTKILDKLRRTNVQDGEAGGITQQIGATNVPKDAIYDKTKMCKEFTKQELKLPGLLIIDTPGHESFSNLRVRGTSLCDIAILVIDIMHGLEPQTIESINLLKERKTPFVVALNKIDRLYQWKPQPMADVQNTIKKQSAHTKAEFDERAQQVIVQLAQEGLNAALFYENKNVKEYISLIPTSAHTGDGMGNLVALICELCQTMLAKRLMYCTNLQAVVMEVKAITGMGTTIDVILINGSINEGDTVVLAGTEGPIVTQIRGLLMPQPMKELRVKNQYEHHKTVKAAQGVKIIAKDMEKALAGLPLYVAHDNYEKEYYKEEVAAVLKDTLESIKVQERGVFVQASTLGSLEALLEFLRTSEIPYAGISIGPVHKKDIMKASVMLEHDSQYAVILAFDVKVEREAQELADNLGVRIFTADIIYHLFDAFIKYRDELKRKRQEEFKHIAVFPCKLRVLPQFVFNSRDPIVMGVSVEAGFVKEGTPICVPSKEFVDLGRIAGIEANHKPVDMARQGQEVCIKIMPIPGEAPKMFGRHFDETDALVSKISRQSIDAVKDHFREEMTKQDWRLMVELKKQFEIL